MTVWHWTPNGLAETLQFATEVLPARTLERRVSYADAIQTLSFTYVATPAVAEEMKAAYLANPNQIFLVPEWPTATIDPAGTVTNAASSISVEDTAPYVVGEDLMVGVGDTWEQHEIASVTVSPPSVGLVGSISQAGGFAGTHGEPLYVVPLVQCICPEGLQAPAVVNFQQVQIAFLRVVPIDIPEDPYTQYNSLPFVDDAAAVFGSLEGGVGRASVLANSGFGSFEIIQTEDYTRRSGTLSWQHSTYAERMQLRRFLHSMRGKDGAMYNSTFQPDILLNGLGSWGGSTITIDVKPIDTAANMVGKLLHVWQEGETDIFREVTSATDNSPTSQTLQVASMPSRSGPTLSLLTKCRFDTDEFQLQYAYSQDGLICRLTAQTLEVV